MGLWQNIVALGLVLAAAAYVAFYLVRAGRRRNSLGCPGCSECATLPQRRPLVRIEPSESQGHR
jgi:hypothetical protein